MKWLSFLFVLFLLGCPAPVQPEAQQDDSAVDKKAQSPQDGIPDDSSVETMELTFYHMIAHDGISAEDQQKLQALQHQGWQVVYTDEEVLLLNTGRDGQLNLVPSVVRVTKKLQRHAQESKPSRHASTSNGPPSPEQTDSK